MRNDIGLQFMVLDLILEFLAWATSRPEYESALTGDTLYDEIQKVQEMEREQGTFTSFFGMQSSSIQAGPIKFLGGLPTVLLLKGRGHKDADILYFIETSRLRLLEFITRIKNALAALTDLTF